MPYSIRILTIDLGNILPPPAAISAEIAADPGGIIETARATRTGTLDINFTSSAAPPAGAGYVHITDSRTSGDICRSGRVPLWPASPVDGELLALPPSVTTFTTAALNRMAGRASGTAVPIPLGATIASGGLTGLMFAPTGLTITGISVAPMPPNVLMATIVGTVAFRQFLFATSTPFTAAIALSIAPSGDAQDRSRIFKVGVLTAALNPGVITPGVNFILSLLTPIVAQFASGEIEKALNGLIATAASDAVKATDPSATLAPEAAVCALSVAATTSELALRMVVSNPLGPTMLRRVAPNIGTMQVAISPAPIRDASRTYVFRVTDAATGAAIPGARVDVVTGNATGNRMARTASTGPNGEATLTLTLRDVRRRIGAGRAAEIERVPPELSVSKAGFRTFVQTLLDPLT